MGTIDKSFHGTELSAAADGALDKALGSRTVHPAGSRSGPSGSARTLIVRSDEPRLSAAELAAIDATLVPPPECIPFSSRAPRVPWYDRADPFALGSAASIAYRFDTFSKPAWKRVAAPRGPRWQHERIFEFEPLHPRSVGHGGGYVERVVAILSAWRVCTSQQIACCAQMPMNKVHTVLGKMLRAGLVERGRMVAELHGFRVPALYRLRKGKELNAYLEAIGPERAGLILFGQEPISGGHERHDVLASELALRAAEIVPDLQGVLGERNAAAADLLADRPKTKAVGDFVLVRADGLRVVFEVTTQPRIEKVREKIARWGRLLGERGGITATGVAVVFVCAARSTREGRIDALKHNFERALTPTGLGSNGQSAPATLVHAARTSIFCATSEEWFPERWWVAERFAQLCVHFSVATGEWGIVSLADAGPAGVEFTPKEVVDWRYLAKVRHKLLALPPFCGGPMVSHAQATAS